MSHFEKESFQKTMSRETVEEILKYPIKALPDRGITKETCEYFEVRVALSAKEGTPIEAIYFPYKKDGKTTGFKKRDLTLPKSHRYHFTAVGEVSATCELFGQDKGPDGGKKVFIVEGEYDALATHQAFKAKYPNNNPKIMSVGLGTVNAAKHIGNNLKVLEGFQETVLAFDMDEATEEDRRKGIKRGKEATEDVANLLPDVRVAVLPCNDPNECLMKGKGEDLYWALVSKSKKFKPDGFVTVDDVWDEATRMPQWGDSYPWPSLTNMTYGMRDGEGLYFGSGVKMGKSEALNQITHHVTQVLKQKIALFKLEEKPSMTVRKLAGKIKRKQFHIPDADFTQEELIDGVTAVKSSGVLLYDSYKSTSWDTLKLAIRHAVVVEGATKVAIDPITRLTAGMSPADTNTELERVADEMATMAKDLGFFYIFFCHLKSPQAGKPHEEGGKVHSNQFTGSRAMMRACYYMVGMEGNKISTDSIKRNTRTFVLLEDRMFGNSGRFDAFYNRDTGEFLEPDNVDGEEF